MTRLLVSVRDVAEARLAVDAGVDLVDVKEPNRGSLGRADMSVVREIVTAVRACADQSGDGCALSHRTPRVSVALGELAEFDPALVAALPEGISFVKLGLAGCGDLSDWPRRWANALNALPPAVARVAVVYADRGAVSSPPADEILAVASDLGCVAVLVDTFDKRAGRLLDHWSRGDLGKWISDVKSRGQISVVAGGLTLGDVERVVALAPDFVAVRGAACRATRTGAIDRNALASLVAAIRRFKSHDTNDLPAVLESA